LAPNSLHPSAPAATGNSPQLFKNIHVTLPFLS
jgi:hypothetical protein